jgi:hypothetical protein
MGYRHLFAGHEFLDDSGFFGSRHFFRHALFLLLIRGAAIQAQSKQNLTAARFARTEKIF